jgi:tetratricopeptide (TPR) repeat protein
VSEPAISLCMIVRDEAGSLPACLASVAGVVDELVVVDTGSRDGTGELARAAGARVVEWAWCGDFAAARNCSLEAARGDWVLVLDADETLLEPHLARARLLAFARAAGARAAAPAGQLEVHNLVAGGERSRALVSRFFPSDPAVRFERRIHEQLARDGRPLAGRPTGVALLHQGYLPEQLAARGKLARNEALLRAELAERADDGYAWYQLGRTLEVGERFDEALAAYERAVELAGDDDPHLAHLLESAATCLRALDRSAQALAWLSEVENDFAERPDTVFLLALLAMDVGQLERAERGFRRCLELGAGPARATGAESSEAARGLAPAHNLGVLYEHTGRPAEARAAYLCALELAPEHAGARAGLARLEGAASLGERPPGLGLGRLPYPGNP